MDSDSGESSSEQEDDNPSSNDEKARLKKPKRAAPHKPTKTPKAPRSLVDIQAEYKTNKQVQCLPPNSSAHSTSPSPMATTTSHSGSSQDVISAPNGDAWDDVVTLFQEVIQDYRDAVMTRDDKDDDAFGNVEKALKDIGLTLFKRSRRHDSSDQVQAKCQQFLQYVSSYCQHHNQAEMQAFFENLLSQHNEGLLFYLKIFFVLNFVQVTKILMSVRKESRKSGKGGMEEKRSRSGREI